MFIKLLRSSIIPLLSTSILMLGCGLINTVINLRINDDTYNSSMLVGLVTSIYYAGMLAATFGISSMIFRVGHMRAYAAFASGFLISLSLLLFSEDIYVVIISRFISGYAIGALFVTIESWMLSLTDKSGSGKMLSLYMIAMYGSSSIGQLFLKYIDYGSMYSFYIAIMLASLSVIPISIVSSKKSEYEKPSPVSFKKLVKLSPSGFVGCAIAGMICAVTFGLIPVYFDDLHYSDNDIGNFMAVTIIGGVMLQYPLGALSDYLDRRKVLLGICLCMLLVSIVILTQRVAGISNNVLIITLLFIFGGVSFSIYPISMSHTCDMVKSGELVQVTQALLFSYGSGSVLGPIFSAYIMKQFGPPGLFASFIFYALILSTFFWYRVFFGEKPRAKDEQDFVVVPSTTPIATELDPRTN